MRILALFGLVALQASAGFGQAVWAPETKLPPAGNFPAPSASFLDMRQKFSGLEVLTQHLAGSRPWLAMPANSEQRQPVYLGWRPRAIELGRGGGTPGLPISLKEAGQRQAAAIWAALQAKKLVKAAEVVELEGWPARDDDGQLTWAFAWWRPLSAANPNWLEIALPETDDLAPFLPQFVSAADKKGYDDLFADVLDYKDLYQKPLFGDAVWLHPDGAIAAAWLPPDNRTAFAAAAVSRKLSAVVLPQPARVNGVPVSYRLNVRGDAVRWPDDATWLAPVTAGTPPASSGV